MSLHLDFLNKNLYRKYPLRASSTSKSTNGIEIPLALFSGCKISTTYAYRNIYIRQIYVSGNKISVTIVHRDDPVSDDSSLETTLGVFKGTILADYQALTLEPFVDFISGHLVVGRKAALSALDKGYILTYDNGKIEDSLIFCYATPTLSKITTNSKKTLTGHITTELSNILEEVVSNTINLTTDDAEKILSNGDISAEYGNCPNPEVLKINTVDPDENGNIDIFGIEPVKIHILSGKLSVDLTPMTLDSVCTSATKNIPPQNASNTYYSNILIVTEAEFKTWPQYQ